MQAHQLFSDGNQWDAGAWPPQVEHLQSLFASQPRHYWCELLEGTDACFAPVLSYGEVQDHPHARERGSYVDIDGQWQPVPAPRFSATVAQPAWEESSVGSEREILEEFGLDKEFLDALP